MPRINNKCATHIKHQNNIESLMTEIFQMVMGLKP